MVSFVRPLCVLLVVQRSPLNSLQVKMHHRMAAGLARYRQPDRMHNWMGPRIVQNARAHPNPPYPRPLVHLPQMVRYPRGGAPPFGSGPGGPGEWQPFAGVGVEWGMPLLPLPPPPHPPDLAVGPDAWSSSSQENHAKRKRNILIAQSRALRAGKRPPIERPGARGSPNDAGNLERLAASVERARMGSAAPGLRIAPRDSRKELENLVLSDDWGLPDVPAYSSRRFSSSPDLPPKVVLNMNMPGDERELEQKRGFIVAQAQPARPREVHRGNPDLDGPLGLPPWIRRDASQPLEQGGNNRQLRSMSSRPRFAPLGVESVVEEGNGRQKYKKEKKRHRSPWAWGAGDAWGGWAEEYPEGKGNAGGRDRRRRVGALLAASGHPGAEIDSNSEVGAKRGASDDEPDAHREGRNDEVERAAFPDLLAPSASPGANGDGLKSSMNISPWPLRSLDDKTTHEQEHGQLKVLAPDGGMPASADSDDEVVILKGIGQSRPVASPDSPSSSNMMQGDQAVIGSGQDVVEAVAARNESLGGASIGNHDEQSDVGSKWSVGNEQGAFYGGSAAMMASSKRVRFEAFDPTNPVPQAAGIAILPQVAKERLFGLPVAQARVSEGSGSDWGAAPIAHAAPVAPLSSAGRERRGMGKFGRDMSRDKNDIAAEGMLQLHEEMRPSVATRMAVRASRALFSPNAKSAVSHGSGGNDAEGGEGKRELDEPQSLSSLTKEERAEMVKRALKKYSFYQVSRCTVAHGCTADRLFKDDG